LGILLSLNTIYAVGVFKPSAERYLTSVGMRFFRAERGKTAYSCMLPFVLSWSALWAKGRQNPLEMRATA